MSKPDDNMPRRVEPTARLSTLLAHPTSLVTIGILLINDHVLKGAGVFPGWFTGKLSDLAGLFFFPLLLGVFLAAVAALMGIVRRSEAYIRWAAWLTAAVFALVNTSSAFNEFLGVVWGPFTVDPSDLLCLPATWFGYLWAKRTLRDSVSLRASRRARAVAILLAALASLATQPPPQRPRKYPYWEEVSRESVHLDALEISVRELEKLNLAGDEEGVGVQLLVTNDSDVERTVRFDDVLLEPVRQSESETLEYVSGSTTPKETTVKPNGHVVARSTVSGLKSNDWTLLLINASSPEAENSATLCLHRTEARGYRRGPETTTLPCRSVRDVHLIAWTVRSGKDGFGLLLRALNRSDENRTVRLESVRFRSDAGSGSPIDLQHGQGRSVDVSPGNHADLYVPVKFDNQTAWNEGVRRGRLSLDVRLDDRRLPKWGLDVVQSRDAPHCHLEYGEAPEHPHHCRSTPSPQSKDDDSPDGRSR